MVALSASPLPVRLFPLLALLLLPVARAQDAADTTETAVRGVWITNTASNVLTSKENIADAMDYLASNGFNVVFPVVWNNGYTLYPSQVMVDYFGERYRQDNAYTGQQRDPLAEVVAEARRVGLEVIPWFEYGFATSFSADGGHILDAYPEWATAGTDGELVVKNGFDWANGLHPGPQGLLRELMLEVVARYDIDGVQGDDRLPAMPSEAGYSDWTRALYASEHDGAAPPTNTQDQQWLLWRSRKLTQWLGTVYRGVKEADPDLYVSLSPSPWTFGYTEYLQNVPMWIDSAYVDLLHPQLYNPVGNQISRYQDLVRTAVGPTPGSTGGYVPPSFRDRLAPGVLGGVGSQPDRNGPAFLVSAVEYNRQFGLGGEVFFYYESLRERNDWAADTLHKYVYEQPARLPGRRPERARRPGLVLTPDSAGVSLVGTWTEDGRAQGFDGTPMRFAAPGTDSRAVYTFTPNRDAGAGAAYDVYAYVPRFRSGATTDALYEIDGASDVRLDQRSSYNLGFVYLATVTADEGDEVTVTLRPDAVTDGRATYADALLAVRNFGAARLGLVTSSQRPAAPQPGLTVRVAPNPARGWATFGIDAGGAQATVRLYDALGRQVARRTAPAGQALDVSTDGLAAGLYLWRAEAGGRAATGTLVVAPR